MFENSIHIALVSMALIFLINAFYTRKIAYQLLALMLLTAEGYRHVEHLSESVILHLSLDLVLIAVLSYVSSSIKSKFPRILYLFASVLLFGYIHQNYQINPSISVADDQQAELILEFNSEQDLLAWKDTHDDIYSIIYPVFYPEDKNFKLDEYLAIDLKEAEDPSTIKQLLLKDKQIMHVEFNDLVELRLPASDTKKIYAKSSENNLNDPLSKKQWVAGKFDMNAFHQRFDKQKAQNSEQTIIAILDTGVDAIHEDLIDNYYSTNKRYDNDPRGHGTHCAGIAAAVTGNNIGIASWIPSGLNIKVTSIKVLNFMGMGTQVTIINGIIEAADSGAKVISLSLGMPSTEDKEKAYAEAVQYANSKGAIVVVAAGNSNIDARDYAPANTEGVICVTAINENLEKAYFANDISEINMGIAAPGTYILSTIPKNKYEEKNGTSMAAPYVSGLIGLIKHFYPTITTREVYDLINKTAIIQNDLVIINPFQLLDSVLEESI